MLTCGVYYKVGLFSAALFAAPIAAYFLTRDHLFDGDATKSGFTAAMVANIVLAGYIVVACLETDEPPRAKKE